MCMPRGGSLSLSLSFLPPTASRSRPITNGRQRRAFISAAGGERESFAIAWFIMRFTGSMERREERKVSHSLLSHTGLSRLHNTVAVAAAHTLTHCARCFSRESARAKELRVSDFFLRASTLARFITANFSAIVGARMYAHAIYIWCPRKLFPLLSLFLTRTNSERRERERGNSRARVTSRPIWFRPSSS